MWQGKNIRTPKRRLDAAYHKPQHQHSMAPLSSRTALVRTAGSKLFFFVVPLLCVLQRTTAWTGPVIAQHVRRSFLVEPPHRSAPSGNDVQRYDQGRIPVGAGGSDVFTTRQRVQRIRTASLVAHAVVASSSGESRGRSGYTVEEVGKCRLEALPALKNRYYALRHGQSVANMEGIISSDPQVGAVSHGLTSNGRAQARAAATALIEVVGRERLDSLVFVSSEFLRARQTAEECRAALQNIISFERQATAGAGRGGDGGGGEADAPSEGAQWVDSGEAGGYDVCPPVVTRQELRERSFGELDGTILINYNKVWPEDLKDGKQEGYGVESVCDVAARVGRLVRSLEEEFEDASIVFSSHADTLQIAQCHLAGADERLFSQYRFKNGEVRSLLQDPSSLPPPNPLSFK